jgi:hypothetical protein
MICLRIFRAPLSSSLKLNLLMNDLKAPVSLVSPTPELLSERDLIRLKSPP